MRYRGRYLLMRRTQGGGETRLRDRYTLGVGGHINPEDVGETRCWTACGLAGLEEIWPLVEGSGGLVEEPPASHTGRVS